VEHEERDVIGGVNRKQPRPERRPGRQIERATDIVHHVVLDLRQRGARGSSSEETMGTVNSPAACTIAAGSVATNVTWVIPSQAEGAGTSDSSCRHTMAARMSF
jgi:hypothetical protein